MRGQAGELKDAEIKRKVVLWSSLGVADPQLPHKISIVAEPGKAKMMGKANYDFSVVVNTSTKHNLRASSEIERQQWMAVLTQHCFTAQAKGAASLDIEENVTDLVSPSQAVAKDTYEDRFVHYTDCGLKAPLVADCEMVRVCVPGQGLVKLNAAALMKLLKDLVGKDLSKFALPVSVNEPTSILQRTSEYMLCNHFLTEASRQESSTKRMFFVAARVVCVQHVLPARTGKPFNPLLGETFELLTPEFRYFSEMVSHHPPIFACACEGEGYEYRRCAENVQQFTGKVVKAYDKNMATIDLYVANGAAKDETVVETYRFKEPDVVAGNLVVGTRYVEPHGQAVIRCEQTGDVAEVTFKARGWTKSEKDANAVHAVIKDAMGKECYSIEGKYTEKLIATDLLSGEQWVLFSAPKKPDDHARMFQMSLFALQLNVLSDDLRQLIPPTDCRLRPDLHHWDQANLEAAEVEKRRQEQSQR